MRHVILNHEDVTLAAPTKSELNTVPVELPHMERLRQLISLASKSEIKAEPPISSYTTPHLTPHSPPNSTPHSKPHSVPHSTELSRLDYLSERLFMDTSWQPKATENLIQVMSASMAKRNGAEVPWDSYRILAERAYRPTLVKELYANLRPKKKRGRPKAQCRNRI